MHLDLCALPITTNSDDGVSIALHQSISGFENADKIKASPDGHYLYVLQNTDPKNPEVTPRLFVFKVSQDGKIKQSESIAIPNCLEVITTPDNSKVYLLSETGSVLTFAFDHNGKLISKGETGGLDQKFDKAAGVISEDGKYLYQGIEKSSFHKNYRTIILRVFAIGQEDFKLTKVQRIDKTNNEHLEGVSSIAITKKHLFLSSPSDALILIFNIDGKGKLTFNKEHGKRYARGKTSREHILNSSLHKDFLASAPNLTGTVEILQIKKDGSLGSWENISTGHTIINNVRAFQFDRKSNLAVVLDKYNRLHVHENTGRYDFDEKIKASIGKDLDEGGKSITIAQNTVFVLTPSKICSYRIDSFLNSQPYTKEAPTKADNQLKTKEFSQKAISMLDSIGLKSVWNLGPFKNAEKLAASTDGKYLFIVQNPPNYQRYPRSSVFVFEKKKSGGFVQVQQLTSSICLSVTLSSDNKAVFLLSAHGKVGVYVRSEDGKFVGKRRASSTKREKTTQPKKIYERGKLALSNDEKFLYSAYEDDNDPVVQTYTIAPNTFDLNLLQTIDEDNTKDLKGAAGLAVGNGHVYVSAQRHYAIQHFQILEDGTLNYNSYYQPYQGQGLSDAHILAIDREKNYLTSGSDYNGRINRYKINKSGSLTPNAITDFGNSLNRIRELQVYNSGALTLALSDYNKLVFFQHQDSAGYASKIKIPLTKELGRISDFILKGDTLFLLDRKGLCAYQVSWDKLFENFQTIHVKKPMKMLSRDVSGGKFTGEHPFKRNVDSILHVAQRGMRDLKRKVEHDQPFGKDWDLMLVVSQVDEKETRPYLDRFLNSKMMKKLESKSKNEKLSFADRSLKAVKQFWEAFFERNNEENFDAIYGAQYIETNFDEFINRDGELEIDRSLAKMTSVYNAIYTYRENAVRHIGELQTKELDKKLLGMQMRVKGAKLSSSLNSAGVESLQDELSTDEIAIELVRYNNFGFENYFISDSNKIRYVTLVVRPDSPRVTYVPLSIDKEIEDKFKSTQQSGRINTGLMSYIEDPIFYRGFLQPLEKISGW